MAVFTIVFLIFLALATGLRLYLSRRQIRSVRENRDHVPAPFDETISLEDHQKAADYSVARNRLGMIDSTLDAVFLLGWTLAGGLSLVLGLWGGSSLPAVWTGTGAILSVFLIASLLNLPVSAYSTFSIEARFGFNRTTLGVFIADLFKGWLLMVILGGPLIAAVLWLMAEAGKNWWLYAWLLWS